jgi:hypothetical protein
MEFSVEKYISNFVENQFPQFYQEDGPTFILFMKAYYEWMESEGNPIGEARSLFDNRDIDNTTEDFLQHFQKKYLYGIPFDIISNKRFLLKHILDVYRSKGSIYCYKLLFRLIYDEDVDIYLPGTDVMRVSDGNWYKPQYLEITDNDVMKDWVGKTIVGTSSNTFAVVENYVQQRYNNDIVNLVYITNVLPNGGEFIIGEKIIRYDFFANSEINYQAPVVLGSMYNLDVTIGGQDFNVGDVLKLVYRDPITDDIISYGKEGLIRVAEVFKQIGALTIRVQSSGFGFTANSLTFLYNDTYDKTGTGGGFNIRNLYSKRYVLYNDDIIYNYKRVYLNDATFGFDKNLIGNINSTLNDVLTYKGGTFGRILNLRNIKIGNNYTKPATTFTRSVITSNELPGKVTYSADALEVRELIYTGIATNYNNTDIITVVNLRSNVNIRDARGTTDPAELHDIVLVSNGAIYQFYANSQGFSNTSDVIYIYQADDYFAKGDKVYYQVPTNNTALRGLTGNNYYWINFVNTTSIALTANALGTNATLSLSTNSTGGNLSFVVTNPGTNFINLNPTIVVSNSIGGNSSGSGAVFDVGFAYYVTGSTPVLGANVDILAVVREADNPAETHYIEDETGTQFAFYANGNGFSLLGNWIKPIKLSRGYNVANVSINNTAPGANSNETHSIVLVRNNVSYNFYANSSGFDYNTDTIKISSASSYFAKGDRVYYQVPNSNTPLNGLTGNTYYYVNFVNSSSIALEYSELTFGQRIEYVVPNGNTALDGLTGNSYYYINYTNNYIVTLTSDEITNANFGTVFSEVFEANDVICFQANSADSNTVEFQVIKEVVSNTKMYLYGNTIYNSTDKAKYFMAPTTIPANFAIYDTLMYSANGSINGENERITAIPSSGNNAIKSVTSLDSGIGYVEGEEVTAYLYNAVSDAITIVQGGTGYANNEKLVFAGGDPGTIATGFITTNTSGGIVDATVLNGGSGYRQAPQVLVQTKNGKNAFLTSELVEFNTLVEVTGLVNKKGIGEGKGFWNSTRSFLDSDKYIQDSYYYQDYSYEIRAAKNLSKYKDIINETFHSAGSELFGKYLYKDLNTSIMQIAYDQSYANTDPVTLYTLVSGDFITCDEDHFTVDTYVYDYYEYADIPTVSVDNIAIKVDNITNRSDFIVISVDRDLNSNGDIYVHLTADSNSRFVTSDIIAY